MFFLIPLSCYSLYIIPSWVEGQNHKTRTLNEVEYLFYFLQSPLFIFELAMIPLSSEAPTEATGLQHRCFLVKFTKCLRTPILKNICERQIATPKIEYCPRSNKEKQELLSQIARKVLL